MVCVLTQSSHEVWCKRLCRQYLDPNLWRNAHLQLFRLLVEDTPLVRAAVFHAHGCCQCWHHRLLHATSLMPPGHPLGPYCLQVLPPKAWDLVLSEVEHRLAVRPGAVQHLLVLLPVPIVYPKIPVSETVLGAISSEQAEAGCIAACDVFSPIVVLWEWCSNHEQCMLQCCALVGAERTTGGGPVQDAHTDA
jgi:hypothetical protein